MNKELVNTVRVHTHTHTHGIYNILVIGNKSAEKTDYVDVQGIEV